MRRTPGFIKRAPRTDVQRSGLLIDSQGRESSVAVIDISPEGFKIAIDDLPRIGDFVRLRIEGSKEAQAQIRWAIAGQAGGVFLREDESPAA